MKPVVIFRHVATEGPCYFATYLSRHDIPWQVIKIDEGEVVPEKPSAFSGMAFMGGPMSVNDALPWIPQALNLIAAAADAGVPVIGHCLGGQLMSKALGGHGETFSIPPGAARLLSSPYCENQVFALGPHLAMQCHVEMTEALIRRWCQDWGKEVTAIAAKVPSVQTPEEIMDAIGQKVGALHAVADLIYDRWTQGLRVIGD